MYTLFTRENQFRISNLIAYAQINCYYKGSDVKGAMSYILNSALGVIAIIDEDTSNLYLPQMFHDNSKVTRVQADILMDTQVVMS